MNYVSTLWTLPVPMNIDTIHINYYKTGFFIWALFVYLVLEKLTYYMGSEKNNTQFVKRKTLKRDKLILLFIFIITMDP